MSWFNHKARQAAQKLPEVRFDRVVSLGRSCQPAWQIRRYTGIREAQVFDWTVTSDAALRAALSNGLDDWFGKDQLDFVPQSHATDRRTGVRFLHEFASANSLDEGYERNAARMAALVMRWHVLMLSGEALLFVRSHFDDPDVDQSASALVDLLMQTTTNAFELLYLVPPAEYDPDCVVDGVRFAALDPKPEGFDWKGDDQAWDRVLSEVGAPRQIL